MIFAVVLGAMLAGAGGIPSDRLRRHSHGGNDICDDPHDFIHKITTSFDLPTSVYAEPRPSAPHAVYGPPLPHPSHKPLHNIVIRPVHTTIIKLRPANKPFNSAPLPVHSQPAPVFSNPAPVYSHPTPVYSNPAPVFSNPAPVYSNPAPVYSNPAPVYSNPTPIYSKPTPVYTAPVPKPTIIGYEVKEHKPQYILGPKEVHTTTVDRKKVSIPVVYSYTVEQPTYTIRTYPAPAPAQLAPPRPGLTWDPRTRTWC